MNTGQRIAYLRKRHSLSQPALAEKLNVSQSTVAMWESNKRNVGNEDLKKLATLFKVQTDYLLGQAPEWATDKDVNDLEKFLLDNEGSMTYGGEQLTEEEKQQVKVAMRTIFWKRHKHD